MTRLITSLRLIEVSIGMDGTLLPGYEILTERQICTDNLKTDDGESPSDSH